MTMEDYLHYDQEAFKTPNHGDIVDGIVVRVDADEVLVDIGAKAEGVISSKELGMRGDVDAVGIAPASGKSSSAGFRPEPPSRGRFRASPATGRSWTSAAPTD